jgi:hypothetical protein
MASILAVVSKHRQEDGAEPADTAGKAVGFLAARIRHREIAYLFMPVAIANYAISALGRGTTVFLGASLSVLAVLALSFAVVLLVLTLARGFPPAGKS